MSETLVDLFRARGGSELAPDPERASTSSSLSSDGAVAGGGSSERDESERDSVGPSRGPNQSLTEESKSYSPEPENQRLSQLSNSHDTSMSSLTVSLTTTGSSSSLSAASNRPCEYQCCTNFNIPYHPLAVDSSKTQQLYSVA